MRRQSAFTGKADSLPLFRAGDALLARILHEREEALNVLSVGPLSITLLCVYLSFYHLWFYRKVPALKANLYFSLSALAVGFYAFASAMVYQVNDPGAAVFWNRFQVSAAVLFCPPLLCFVSLFVGRRLSRAHGLYSLLALMGAAATMFTNWVFTEEFHKVHIAFLQTEFFEGDTGPGAYAFSAWVVGVLIYSTWLLLWALKQGMNWIRPMLVACFLFYPIIVNDLLVLLQVYQSLYLTEYGFLVIVLGVAVTLADRFFWLHGQVESLNTSLQEKSLEIQASAKRYRALFEEAKDGIILFSHRGIVRLANPYLLSLIGISPPFKGLPNLERLFQRDYPEIKGAMRALTEGSIDRFDMEADLTPPDAPWRSVSLGISLLERTPQETLYQGIARDITEQKKWRKEILHQDRMSSLGVLAGGVSHEFNNFLASISGFAQLALIAKKPGDVQRAAEMIIEQAERATQVTQNLLRFAGSSKGAPREEIDLKALLDQSLMLVEKEAEKARIQIVRDYGDAPSIHSSPVSLEQVLVNLYINARDAIDSGGTLTVRAKANGNHCVIEVEDDGPGIPSEDLHRIFEPFYTTKGAMGRGKQKGVGLGLAISHGLVRELDGEIRAENIPDGGTRFTVLLPLS
jgi:PAS domain S-box-containing protein